MLLHSTKFKSPDSVRITGKEHLWQAGLGAARVSPEGAASCRQRRPPPKAAQRRARRHPTPPAPPLPGREQDHTCTHVRGASLLHQHHLSVIVQTPEKVLDRNGFSLGCTKRDQES